jgi:hypothetical protein
VAQYRADFYVKGSLALARGSDPLVIASKSPDFEIQFTNAPRDASGHVPGLIVHVTASADSLDGAAEQFRGLLAQQLDLLSFVTHCAFAIVRCLRVIEWEPHQKRRRMLVFQDFDPLDPPDPELTSEFADTVHALIQAGAEDYVLRALRSFRYGTIERQPEDQFQHFWHAIETIAEGSKTKTRIPIPCPKCQHDLFCRECNKSPMRRPMARQAIRELFAAIRENGGDEFYRDLVGTRDHLLHGRSPDSVEREIGYPLPVLVNEAGKAAWQAIMHSLPALEGSPAFGHRDGNFVNLDLVMFPDMTFEYDGVAPRPSEDQIPKVQVTMKVTFKEEKD